MSGRCSKRPWVPVEPSTYRCRVPPGGVHRVPSGRFRSECGEAAVRQMLPHPPASGPVVVKPVVKNPSTTARLARRSEFLVTRGPDECSGLGAPRPRTLSSSFRDGCLGQPALGADGVPSGEHSTHPREVSDIRRTGVCIRCRFNEETRRRDGLEAGWDGWSVGVAFGKSHTECADSIHADPCRGAETCWTRST